MALKIQQKTVRQHISSEDDVMTFGVHKGSTVFDILHDEPKYFDWLLSMKIITVTPEMGDIITEAVLEFMDNAKGKRDDYGDWEDVPY